MTTELQLTNISYHIISQYTKRRTTKWRKKEEGAIPRGR